MLPESEKEALRNLPQADFLTESTERDESHRGTSHHSDYNSTADSDNDVSKITLRRALGQSSPSSLRHRHLNHILDNRLQEKQRLKEQEE